VIKCFILQSSLIVAAAILISGCASTTEQGVVTENGQTVPGAQVLDEGRITPVATGATAGAALGW
jgi:hypothetical protein